MRPLKFRVWDKNEQGYIRYPLAWLPMFDNPDGLEIECCGALAVEQYTGLNDKDDKEVYEGDIVRWESSTGREITAPIIWNTKAWCWTAGGYMLSGIYELEVEVVGNIHQDMKLLKEGK